MIDGCVDFDCAVTARSARTLRSPIPDLTTEFPTARDCSNRTSLGKRRIPDCIALDVYRFPAVIDTCRGAVRDGSGAATDQAHRRLDDLRLRRPRRRAEYDESNMQLYQY